MSLLLSILFSFLAFCTSAVFGLFPERQPLFPWEQNHLTEETLATLIKQTNTQEFAQLFAFEDKKSSNPNKLKAGACKVFPGDPDWPSQSSWDAFNKILGNNALIKTIPLAAPCYQNTGLYDPEKCAKIASNYSNPYLHENDPTSTFWPLYQARTCLPTSNPSSSNCTHGGYPLYAVNISSVQQIQLTINFARNNNLRLVIKNTGHDYLGKSSGAGSLSIWTHNLNDISFFPSLNIPGYSGGPALKIAPGATVRQVYEAADKYNGSVLGGICESVGYAGGYVAGGGHTPLSGLYGMAADHVLGLEMVTAGGKYVSVSSTQNKDLFYALRGGGGGVFGVVTSIIVRVHPRLGVVTSVFEFGTSETVSAERFWEGMRAFFESFIPFTDAGTYSWWRLINAGNGQYQFSMEPFFAPNHTIESFNKLISPWFNRLKELGIEFKANTTLHDAYLPAWQSTWGSDVGLNSAGGVFVPANWLLPRRNWENLTLFNETFSHLRRHVEAGKLLFGYHQAPRNRAAVDNAVNPAFREVICFLIVAGSSPQNPTVEEVRRASKELREEILRPLKEIAPVSGGGGAYLNEANVDNEEWREDFYGGMKRYEKLLKIKKRWDKEGVFYATTGIGSEEWEVRDGGIAGVKSQAGRLCRV
ncbi:FAD/FMN-containing isoamyl alcohol oxidase-like protein MreA [Podospora fimiseda]|uniref:FAD/FMN-containing isoamyl alcohol oxidase-like protein MreA n=1 Tax=Podospora fimiseda TaxID=252190 RepID=A0AAN6YSB6_9PEZI|nr:FAD/FMN-containing isoamyl alcohol oxidase-like protein MreA [Podospora fimiseda]